MELLKELVSLPCPAGFEEVGSSRLKYMLSALCDEVEQDANGNIAGYIKSTNPDAPTVMLCAHYDSIGLIVTEICENGFVHFAPLGGTDNRVLPCAEVTLHGKEDIYGVIGFLPPHLLSAEDMKKPLSFKNLAIDTGIPTEKLREIISVGTPVTFKNTLREIGAEISSGCLDDRAGVWALLRTAESLGKKDLPVNLCILLSSSEELGRRGAKPAAYRIRPDAAVIVDATFGKTPETVSHLASKIGKGPVLCKGPVLNRYYVNQLEERAKEKDIPYQLEAEGGDPGTDAFVVGTAGCGIPCVMVSFPLKYMHTGIESVNSDDLENTAKLLEAFVMGFTEVEYA